jgi:hypothetical protein
MSDSTFDNSKITQVFGFATWLVAAAFLITVASSFYVTGLLPKGPAYSAMSSTYGLVAIALFIAARFLNSPGWSKTWPNWFMCAVFIIGCICITGALLFTTWGSYCYMNPKDSNNADVGKCATIYSELGLNLAILGVGAFLFGAAYAGGSN